MKRDDKNNVLLKGSPFLWNSVQIVAYVSKSAQHPEKVVSKFGLIHLTGQLTGLPEIVTQVG